MRVGALVPFKCFTRAKRRLRAQFSDAEVEELGRAMLVDVLEALGAARGLERRQVLTDDDAVAQVAAGAGAEVRLRRPDPGLNPAIDDAAAALERDGLDAALVVLGDLPLLTGPDVDAVIEAGRSRRVVIAPSDDGGTALLYRRPPTCIRARFGPDSAAAHQAEARARGVEAVRFTGLDELVRIDLDTPEDAERLLASRRSSRTRAVLEKLWA